MLTVQMEVQVAHLSATQLVLYNTHIAYVDVDVDVDVNDINPWSSNP